MIAETRDGWGHLGHSALQAPCSRSSDQCPVLVYTLLRSIIRDEKNQAATSSTGVSLFQSWLRPLTLFHFDLTLLLPPGYITLWYSWEYLLLLMSWISNCLQEKRGREHTPLWGSFEPNDPPLPAHHWPKPHTIPEPFPLALRTNVKGASQASLRGQVARHEMT